MRNSLIEQEGSSIHMGFHARAQALIRQMTLAEKLSQLGSGAPAIERLGLKAEPMGSECIHGV
jgi:hypothetical protein